MDKLGEPYVCAGCGLWDAVDNTTLCVTKDVPYQYGSVRAGKYHGKCYDKAEKEASTPPEMVRVIDAPDAFKLEDFMNQVLAENPDYRLKGAYPVVSAMGHLVVAMHLKKKSTICQY